MKADDVIAVAEIKFMRPGVRHIGVQYGNVAVVVGRIAMDPVHELLAYAPFTVLLVHNDVIDIYIAPAVKAGAQPEAGNANTLVINQGGGALIALLQHGRQPLS